MKAKPYFSPDYVPGYFYNKGAYMYDIHFHLQRRGPGFDSRRYQIF
jgi:hypothetical protein